MRAWRTQAVTPRSGEAASPWWPRSAPQPRSYRPSRSSADHDSGHSAQVAQMIITEAGGDTPALPSAARPAGMVSDRVGDLQISPAPPESRTPTWVGSWSWMWTRPWSPRTVGCWTGSPPKRPNAVAPLSIRSGTPPTPRSVMPSPRCPRRCLGRNGAVSADQQVLAVRGGDLGDGPGQDVDVIGHGVRAGVARTHRHRDPEAPPGPSSYPPTGFVTTTSRTSSTSRIRNLMNDRGLCGAERCSDKSEYIAVRSGSEVFVGHPDWRDGRRHSSANTGCLQ